MKLSRSFIALLVAVVALAAAFVFSAQAHAQAETYVDLSVEITVDNTRFVFTVRNQGTAVAYDATVDIELVDQVITSSDAQFKQNSGTTCSGSIPGTTCASGVWPVGRLGAGEEISLRIQPELARGLPCCSDLNARHTVPARAIVKSTVPGEEERFKGDNTAVGWISVKKSSGSGEAVTGRYWLEASVDDLLPDPGDTVSFTFEWATLSFRYIRDVKVRLKLDDGMGTPTTSTSTLPMGTTFAAAPGLTRTWDWNIGAPAVIGHTMVVSTTLDDPLPAGVARSDLCLTAELTARPNNIGVVDRDTYTSAEICLRKDPVTLLPGRGDGAFSPCGLVSEYPPIPVPAVTQ